MYYLHKATSAVSCVKPNASQREVTLHDDVGFPTEIAEYTVANFLRYPIRRRITYTIALESKKYTQNLLENTQVLLDPADHIYN